MNTQITHRFATGFIALATLIAPLASHAELDSSSKKIVVLQPNDLPEQARIASESLLLHADEAGSTYLYLEQQQGTHLAVLDVTNPVKIRFVSNVSLEAKGAFDFVQPLDNCTELIRFRNDGKTAVLDLAKARKPTLRTAARLAGLALTEPLGTTGYLATADSRNQVGATPRTFQIVDTSAPLQPTLLATIGEVQNRAVNHDTGTTFLLGANGLTVIRQTGAEEERRVRELQMDRN